MPKIVVCLKCGEKKIHMAKGLCQKCYTQKYRQKYNRTHKKEISEYMHKYRQTRKKEHSEYMCKYAQNHLEKRRKLNQKWHKNNLEKDRMYHRIASARRRKVYTESFHLYTWIQNQKPFICFYCNQNIENQRFHIDHFIPLSKGGIHSEANLRISCPFCNLRKHTKMPWEFMPKRFFEKDMFYMYLIQIIHTNLWRKENGIT